MKKQAIRLNKNYIVVESWMTQELGLSGSELLVYAMIYGFSQTKNQVCTRGDEYMATWLNTTTRSIIRIKNQLLSRNLIEKVDNELDNRKGGYIALCPQIGDKMSCNLGDNLSPKTQKIGDKMSCNLGDNLSPKTQKIGDNLSCNLGDNLSPKTQKIGDNLSCNSGEIGDKTSRVIKKYVTKCPEIGDKMSSRASLDNSKYNIKNNNTSTQARACARGVMILSASEDYPHGLSEIDKAKSDWKLILNKLEVEINSLGFDIWIKPLVPIGYCDGNIVIVAPSVESCHEVASRYTDKIVAAKQEVA